MARPLPVELWKMVDNIEGWLSQPEADQLYRLCKGKWIEVGSWKGRSTYVLASTGHHGVAIDWFKGSSEHYHAADTYEQFLKNVALVRDKITVVNADYKEAVGGVPDGKFQLLFLDAEHDYEHTKEALELYYPKVKKGGIIILHDVWGWDGERRADWTPWPGVTKYAYELLEDERFEHIEDAHRSMAIRKK